jgi:alkaline phosphatase
VNYLALRRWHRVLVSIIGMAHSFFAATILLAQAQDSDWIRNLQSAAVLNKHAAWGYWGSSPRRYSNWTSHTNRLIPVYLFGGKLTDFSGPRSVYRDEQRLRALYGELPQHTVNPQAEYIDQTDLYRLQLEAWQSGKKKYIFLLVADGMDWQTTQAAAIFHSGGPIYREGRGHGLAIQDYGKATTDFGWMVTSASHASVKIDVNAQRVLGPDVEMTGGYNAELGGQVPWANGVSQEYLMGQSKPWKHLVTDSASSAASMTAGIKTYNSAINVDVQGNEMEPIARQVQRDGWSIGVVTSVPISHATPACAYANNVDRDDYQDLTRDLLGLPSAFRHNAPLTGVDVLIGCGWGEYRSDDRGGQGNNFVPGNRYLAETDRHHLLREDRRYVFSERTPGISGERALRDGVNQALTDQRRLFGYFGTQGGHLPYRTADGDYRPTRGVVRMDQYTAADVFENPTSNDACRITDTGNSQTTWHLDDGRIRRCRLGQSQQQHR